MPGAQQGHIKEQGNNPSNEGRGENAAADLRKQVWDQGVRVLASAGLKERAARSLLGRWVKQHGEGDVLAAVLAGQDRADPVAFIEARLRKRQAAATGMEHPELAAWGIREDEDDSGNFSRGGDHLPPPPRNRADQVSNVLAFPAEESGPLPERDVQAGRGGLELLAL